MKDNIDPNHLMHKAIGFIITVVGCVSIYEAIDFIIDNITMYQTDSHLGTMITTIFFMGMSVAFISRLCFITYNTIHDALEKAAEK